MYSCILCCLYTVLSVHCVVCTLCCLYTVLSVHCVVCALCCLYTVCLYTVLSVHCVVCTLCYLYTVLSVHCVVCTLCYMYTVLSVHCVVCTLCCLYTVLCICCVYWQRWRKVFNAGLSVRDLWVGGMYVARISSERVWNGEIKKEGTSQPTCLWPRSPDPAVFCSWTNCWPAWSSVPSPPPGFASRGATDRGSSCNSPSISSLTSPWSSNSSLLRPRSSAEAETSAGSDIFRQRPEVAPGVFPPPNSAPSTREPAISDGWRARTDNFLKSYTVP